MSEIGAGGKGESVCWAGSSTMLSRSSSRLPIKLKDTARAGTLHRHL